MGQNPAFGTSSITSREVIERDRRAYKDNEAKQTAHRAQLVEAWQSLGMSKDGAQRVAAAYKDNGTVPGHRVSVEDKSDEQIASMLQAALAKKDYKLANETLIAFQKKKVDQAAQASAHNHN